MKGFIFYFFCLLTAGCGLDETTYRADKPVSREAASKEIDIPFPISATNVYYVFHAGGLQEYQLYVRFSVAPEDESNAVDRILTHAGTNDSYPSVPIANRMSPAYPDLSPMSWWKVDSITNGYCRSGTIGQPFYIWADLSQHTIYVHASD
jgi:hypothetical protein